MRWTLRVADALAASIEDFCAETRVDVSSLLDRSLYYVIDLSGFNRAFHQSKALNIQQINSPLTGTCPQVHNKQKSRQRETSRAYRPLLFSSTEMNKY